MRIKGNQKKHKLSRKLGCKITHGCGMKRRRCPVIVVGNLRRQTPLHWQPLMFGLEITEELVHVRLPVIKKGIEVYKGMP